MVIRLSIVNDWFWENGLSLLYSLALLSAATQAPSRAKEEANWV